MRGTSVLRFRVPATDARSHFRHVLLKFVSLTATTNDIRALAQRRPLLGEADTYADSGTDPTRGHKNAREIVSAMQDVLIVRDKFLRPKGSVHVSFSDPSWARLMRSAVQKQALSGQIIEVQQIADVRDANGGGGGLRLLRAMQRLSPGRVVCLRGLPPHVTPQRLERVLGLNYRLSAPGEVDAGDGSRNSKGSKRGKGKKLESTQTRPSYDARTYGPVERIPVYSPEQLSDTYLVRLETVSEAMRLVRRWHRSVWRNRAYDRGSEDAARNGSDIVDDADLDEPHAGDEAAARDGEASLLDERSPWLQDIPDTSQTAQGSPTQRRREARLGESSHPLHFHATTDSNEPRSLGHVRFIIDAQLMH